MRFGRLLVVTVAITICGGLFGGMVGGLIGYATPSSIEAIFGVKTEQAAKDGKLHADSRGEISKDSNNTKDSSKTNDTKVKVGVRVDQQPNTTNMTSYGAALGGASGLILGAVFGMIIAIVDQVLLVIRQKPKEPAT